MKTAQRNLNFEQLASTKITWIICAKDWNLVWKHCLFNCKFIQRVGLGCVWQNALKVNHTIPYNFGKIKLVCP